MATFTINSSNGILTADCKTGQVLTCSLFENGDPHIQLIDEFNIDEWTKYYEREQMPQSIDILDLGYWYFKGEINKKVQKILGNRGTLYENPCFDWRETVINL